MNAFDEVHVVSDLHWVDGPERQIFEGVQPMAAWVHALPADGRRVALVLAGDILDFIAGPDARYLDPERAAKRTRGVLAELGPVIRALGAFASRPGCQLVLLRGNHDVELAFPWVHQVLVEAIAASSNVSVEGLPRAVGFDCMVGDKRVFVIHGNDQDAHNTVDQAAVDRVTTAHQRAFDTYPREVATWQPNRGTRLVVDAMNFVKERHPFIDLLKPESVLNLSELLIALSPANALVLASLASGGAALPFLERLRAGGFLSDLDASPPGGATVRRAGLREAAVRDALRRGAQPTELLGPLEPDPELLALETAVAAAVLGRDPEAALRRGMKRWLDARHAFDDPSNPDDSDKHIDRGNCPEADFLIAGHTHIARCAPRVTGHGTYLNSGTWIRLAKLRSRDIDDDVRWAKVRKALHARTLAEIDQTGIAPSPRNVARVVCRDGVVVGEIGSVKDHGEFVRIAGTEGARS